MSFHNWLKDFRSALAPGRGQGHHGRRGSLRATSHRPKLEVLEDRSVPAFLAPVDYTVASSPRYVEAGDFNADTVQDLATVDGDSVSVLMGNADGTFRPDQTAQNAGLGPFAQSVAVGDFDADGNLDVATGNHDYYSYGLSTDDVTILFGSGDGTIEPAVPLNIDTGSVSWFVATGDLNGDSTVDLVVTSNPPLDSFGSSRVRVLLGQGDGSFAHGGGFSTGSDLTVDFYAPVLADFNSDGNMDVVVPASRWNLGLVKVSLGNGDGTLQPPRDIVTYSGTTYTATATVGDFNGDGRPDLAMVNHNHNSTTRSILLGNGDGTFQAPQAISWGALGDFNGDGAPDLVETQAEGLSVRLGNGDGSFASPILVAAGSYNFVVVVADFNGDGRPDVAVTRGSNAVAVLLNDGDWPVPPPAVSVRDAIVTEDNTGAVNATFILTLVRATNVDVTVHYDTADISAAAGSDYAAAAGDVIIPAGQTSGTFTVVVKGDRLAEPTETFAVNLTSATNATIGDGRGIGTILDNEPRIRIGDVTKREGNGRKTTLFTFTVTLSSAYDQAVTMSFQTANGTATTGDNDYIARTGTLTFAPGETTKTITIEVKGDNKREANETFNLNLFGNSGNSLITKNRGLGTIWNDD